MNNNKTPNVCKIPSKRKYVMPDDASSNRKRKLKKPWWSKELTNKWNEVCKLEKRYIRCTDNYQRKYRRIDFVQCRKKFNRLVQRSKRLY